MRRLYLGWQWISGGDSAFVRETPDEAGYSVYAPVMYKAENETLEMIRDFRANIALAKKNGFQVWLTFQQFGSQPNLQEKLAGEMVAKALEHGADGINVDFEGMGKANRDRFTAFIRTLYNETRKKGIVLSVDVVRPAVSMYSLCYDREALAQACDYLVLMAYDQHWATSPQEGSVADLPWTEDSLLRLLSDENVPSEKLILAVPFYTRNWKIRGSSLKDMVVLNGVVNLRSGPGTQYPIVYTGRKNEGFAWLGEMEGEPVGGRVAWYRVELKGTEAYVSSAYSTRKPRGEHRNVTSTAIGMQAGLDIVANYNPRDKTSSLGNSPMYQVEIADDPQTGQTLVSYRDGDGELNKIWLEDYLSLRKRHRLAEKYNLAGVAAWSLEWMDKDRRAWWKMRGA